MRVKKNKKSHKFKKINNKNTKKKNKNIPKDIIIK